MQATSVIASGTRSDMQSSASNSSAITRAPAAVKKTPLRANPCAFPSAGAVCSRSLCSPWQLRLGN